MSNPGDVVWADGVAWQRDTDKNWYSTDRYDPRYKKELKAFKDFRWLVKDGELLDQLKDARSQRNQWANEETRHWLNTDEPSLKDRWRRAWDDGHDCGVECGSSEERAAIVAWLRARPSGYYGGARVASDIERGAHVRGDDE